MKDEKLIIQKIDDFKYFFHQIDPAFRYLTAEQIVKKYFFRVPLGKYYDNEKLDYLDNYKLKFRTEMLDKTPQFFLDFLEKLSKENIARKEEEYANNLLFQTKT